MAKPVIKSADELYEWQQAIRAATGRQDVADVIGAWMSGLPTASMVDRIKSDIVALNDENKPSGWSDWVLSQFGKVLVGPIALLGSAAGNIGYGDKIWTIEKQCPNGPPLSDALSILKDADSDLYRRVTETGQLQREVVAKQANDTARENLGRDLLSAAKYAGAGLDDLTGGLVTVAKWGLLAWVAAKIYGAARKS